MKPKLSIVSKPQIYLMALIYLFILFPIVFCMLYAGIKLDRFYGFPKLIIVSNAFNVIFAFLLIFSGVLIVWWSYTYLVIRGEGSPAQMLGRTKRLVTSGPYSVVRHPSVIGKLFGALGLGLIFNSFSFVFIIFPFVLCYIFIERIKEEKTLTGLWQKEYLEYKRKVPFMLPGIKFLKNYYD